MKSLSPLASKALAGLPSGDMAGPSLDASRSRAVEPGSSVRGRRKPERVWSLWRANTLAYAETDKHPLGYVVRLYVSGRFLFSSVRPTRELAEQEAQELKRAGLAKGWTEQPPTPDE